MCWYAVVSLITALETFDRTDVLELAIIFIWVLTAIQPPVFAFLCVAGQTALHLAVQSNNVQAVMILIDNGAKIDTCDGSNGRTPLHYAFEQNNLTMARILLANGATPILPSYSTPVPFTQRCRTDVSRLHDVYVAADVKG
jgi:ankyrin repeat protein